MAITIFADEVLSVVICGVIVCSSLEGITNLSFLFNALCNIDSTRSYVLSIRSLSLIANQAIRSPSGHCLLLRNTT